MFEDNLQRQRFELKYRVSAQAALQIRDYVNSYLQYDENSVGKPDCSYPNHTIYLDSPGMDLYWSVINGSTNRFKLRVRFYDDDPASPVFFEIKRRQNGAILKQRCAVRREAVPSLLAGQLPELRYLYSSQPKARFAMQEFCRLMMSLQAVPKSHVGYLREAWFSPGDNSVRITLDRKVRTSTWLTSIITTRMRDFVMPFEPDVILELKFTGRYPDWLREMVQFFEVTQSSAAKYVDGVASLNEQPPASRQGFQLGT